MIKGKITKGASTVRTGVKTDNIFYKKLKDMSTDEMANHNCEVAGLIVYTSYALVCHTVQDDEIIGVNIPAWVGESLYADFKDSELTADEYFSESYLAGFDTIKTTKGIDTHNPIFE